MIEITERPIDTQTVIRSVEDPAAGGIDVFIGTTRNHSRHRDVLALEYSAYAPMALRTLEQIAGEVRQRWEVRNISIVHRIGRVEIGEASVVIAVSAAHRSEAFDACRYALDTLKKEVPIWKKEFFTDGEVWVGLEGTTPGEYGFPR